MDIAYGTLTENTVAGVNMADSSDDGMPNWTIPSQANGHGHPISTTSNQEQQACEANGSTATARHGWGNSSPSNNSGSTVPSSSAWNDGGSSSLDRSSPAQSAASCAPSTTPEGACWNSGNTGVAQFDDSSPAVWADCDTDSVFAVPQQQQTGANIVNNTAHAPQGGKPYAAGRGMSTGSPDAAAYSQPSGSSSSVAELSLDAYPSTGWSSSGGASRAAARAASEELTPQMQKIIQSDDGWGRTPIRQDTPWPEPDNVEVLRSKIESNQWSSPANNGTAIWDCFRVKATPGTSSQVAGSWQDRRGSTLGDRSANWASASVGREGPSWGDSGDRNGIDSGAALDMPSWNALDASGRIRNRTPGTPGSSSTMEVRGAAVSGQGLVNGDSNRGSPPGSGGPFHEWNSGGMARQLRPGESKLSQPGWGEGSQTQGWSNDLQQARAFLGPPGHGLSRQQSQPVSGSPVPWEQPPLGRSFGPSGSVQSAEPEWDASGALGNGSYAWPPAEATGGSQRPPKVPVLNRSDEFSPEVAGGPRHLRYSLDSAMPGGWKNDTEIGEWGSRGAPTSGRMMTSGSKHSAGHGVASKSSGSASFMHQIPTRQQMIQSLCDLGHSRERATKALIDNGMDYHLALADLNRSDLNRSIAGSHQGNLQTVPRALLAPQDVTSGGGLVGAHFHLLHGSASTSGSNAQSGVTAGGKSFMHIHSGRQQQPIAPLSGAMPKMPRQPLNSQYVSAAASGWPSRGINHQQMVQGVQSFIQQGIIPQHALKQQNAGILEEMVQLNAIRQSYQQANSRSMSQMGSQQMEHLESIKQRFDSLAQGLREPHQRQVEGVSEDFLHISLNQQQPYSVPQTQSKLSQWKMTSESESGVLSQASRAPGSKPVSASAGLGTSGDDAWSGGAIGRPKLDANHNESQPSVDDFQIPEFIPGQMWAGGMSMTADDSQLPGSSTFFGGSGKSEEGSGGGWSTYTGVQRSISVPGGVWPPAAAHPGTAAFAAAGNTGVGGAGVDASWSTAPPRAGAGAAPARPPPGLVNYGVIGQSAIGSGYGRRSSTSASWSPSTAGAAAAAASVLGSHWEQLGSLWVVLHGLPPQMDQTRLKALCGQHGVVTAFCPNPGLSAALVQYRCAQEAANAQSNLHCCVIANSAIHAQVVGEEEAKAFVERSPQGTSMASGGLHMMSAWSAGALPPGVTTPSTWSTGGASTSSAPGLGGIHFNNLWQGGAAGVDGSCL